MSGGGTAAQACCPFVSPALCAAGQRQPPNARPVRSRCASRSLSRTPCSHTSRLGPPPSCAPSAASACRPDWEAWATVQAGWGAQHAVFR
jgi:hypothetical protein